MRTKLFVLSILLVSASLRTSFAEDAIGAKAAVAANSNVEILTRGPVHEAFATQFQANAVPGIKLEKSPPNPIEEIPPSVRPAGNNIQWLPGYWGWDAEAKDYLWVSGTYRNAPAGQRWVPGYWNPVNGGAQWISGFWLSAKVNQLSYNAAPPKSLERGPSSDASAANQFWVPGVYEPNGGKYAWRPGYWAPYQQNYVWFPASNVVTAGGYVHTPGYWDYRLDQRGALFAPARINVAANTNAAVKFTPSVLIPATVLQHHLFAQTNSSTYLFGNYYGDQYASAGIRPWYAAQIVQGVPDPLFGYYNWMYSRGGANYLDVMTRWNTHFTSNVNLRPAATLAGQLDLATKQAGVANLATSLVGVSVTDALSASPKGFVNLTADQQTSLLGATQGLRVLSAERLKLEGGSLAVAGNAGASLNLATQALRLPAVELPLAAAGIGAGAGAGAAVAPAAILGEPSQLLQGVPNALPGVDSLPDLGGAVPELPGVPGLPGLPGLPF